MHDGVIEIVIEISWILSYIVLQVVFCNTMYGYFLLMKTIQCTFRLPENVVELIDAQQGGTRTDKLLSLLGFEKENRDYGEMQSVISDGIKERFLNLEARIIALESSHSVSTAKGNSANEARKIEAIEKLNAELDTISSSDYELIRKARYPLSEVRKRTNIRKGQCDSYKDIILKRLGLNA